MAFNLKYCGTLFLMGVSMAYANSPAPIPESYLGLDTLDTSNYSTGSSCVTVDTLGCGGEFTGTLGTGTTNANPIPINFWCVDSQEDFTFGQDGAAQVVELSDIAADSNNVRYSGVTNSPGSPDWTNQKINLGGGDTVTLASSATDRYEMAAYLITQFPVDSSGGLNGNDPEVMAIEGAIWDIMSNSSESNPFSYFGNTGSSQDDSIDYWIYQASLASNYSTTADTFAVVSWDANSDGGLASGGNQTFLVELAPEPGFYGALAVGLCGLFFAVRRRKQA